MGLDLPCLAGGLMAKNPEPGPEEALLRKIVNSRGPSYMGSVLEEFEHEYNLGGQLHLNREDRPVNVLVQKLAHKGLITAGSLSMQQFGAYPQVAATTEGKQQVSENPA